MSKASIASVGFQCASEHVVYLSLDSNSSLLDYDIVVFRPDIQEYLGLNTYNGKPCLSDDDSFKLQSDMGHWRGEIKEAVDGGKTVIVLMSDRIDISVATGGAAIFWNRKK